MNISPNEAEEALADIQKVTTKTRRSIASSGAYVFLMLTGIIWFVGFLATQFLSGEIVAYIWIAMSILGVALSIPLGARMGNRVRSPSFSASAKRVGIFWLLLVFYGIATIAVAQPTDGKQATMLIILFIMIGQMSMGLVLSFSATWWALPITVLALIGYFLFPDIFYLWMAILGGGGMIALALYLRPRGGSNG
jgi:hypothetical protein